LNGRGIDSIVGKFACTNRICCNIGAGNRVSRDFCAGDGIVLNGGRIDGIVGEFACTNRICRNISARNGIGCDLGTGNRVVGDVDSCD
jgi:hypothetical protein